MGRDQLPEGYQDEPSVQLARQPTSAMGHGRPIRLRNWHVRSYVNCGCAKTKGRHSGFGPRADIDRCTNRHRTAETFGQI
jgi:hypothetical protein